MIKFKYLFFSIFIISACSRTTEIDIPSQDKRLVVNCYFTPENTWQVYVGQSTFVLDTTRNLLALPNAQVVISDNISFKDSLKLNNGYYTSPNKPIVGKRYYIEVEAVGFPKVLANDMIPQLPQNIEGRLDTSVIAVDISLLLIPVEYYTIPFQFKDIDSEKNYYKFKLQTYDKPKLKKDSTRYENQFEDKGLTTQDPSVIKLHKEQAIILMDDKLWNGQPKSITGLTSKFLFYPFQISDNVPLENQKIPREVYLDAYSLSENMFLYEKSYLTQQYNKVDPFAEPSNVFSNVKNGYGIFAGYQRKRVRIF